MAKLDYGGIGDDAYTRRRIGKNWQYFTSDGRKITSAKVIARLSAIALPPAYRNARFARHPHAHLQATGIDEKGRLQYRYHDHFRRQRDEAKYGLCCEFGHALPRIRRTVESALAARGLSRERVIAAVVRLLDVGCLRVGNPEYARTNNTYGATTLRNRHAKVSGRQVRFDFIGKSGKRHRISITDRRLATVVRKCQDTPGQLLFQYVDAEGILRPITSCDINQWLREKSGEAFTAKHFRTWAASVIAFEQMVQSKERIKLKDAMEAVAKKLGNTPTIARKSYVHPAVIESISRADKPDWPLPRASRHLSRAEKGLLRLLNDWNGANANKE